MASVKYKTLHWTAEKRTEIMDKLLKNGNLQKKFLNCAHGTAFNVMIT
jgi:hypothetical protein